MLSDAVWKIWRVTISAFHFTQAVLHNRYQSDLTSLENLLDQYSTGPDLAVPVRMTLEWEN